MTKQELITWISSASFEGFLEDEYDDNGNHYQTCIYQKDGKLYLINYWNSAPCEAYVNGYIKEEYQPKEVVRKYRMIKEIYYEYVPITTNTKESPKL